MKYILNYEEYSGEDYNGYDTYSTETEEFNTKEELLKFITKNPNVKEKIISIYEVGTQLNLEDIQEQVKPKIENLNEIQTKNTTIKVGDLIIANLPCSYAICRVDKITKQFDIITLHTSYIYPWECKFNKDFKPDTKIETININQMDKVLSKQILQEMINQVQNRKIKTLQKYEQEKRDKIKTFDNKIDTLYNISNKYYKEK